MLIGDKTSCGRSISELKPNSEKRVFVECEGCNKQRTISFANYNNGQKRIGHTGKTLCVSCASKENCVKRRGQPSPFKGAKKPENQGPNNSNWKGGRYITSDGYIMVWVGHDYTGYKSKWVHYRKEHVFVLEQHLGRMLEKQEIVHHIDGNKQNNDIENLFLTTISGHRNCHVSLQELGYILIKNGLIKFNSDDGTYFFSEELKEKLIEN